VGFRTSAAALVVATLAACALPPRETDRSTPEGTFRTFRGAAARAEFEREWDCLSDDLRRSLGIRSRADWTDARAVVLTQDHLLIRAMKRAKISGPAETLADGRIRLPVAVNAIVFSVRGTVTLRREAVLRGWVPGEKEPRLNERLDSIELRIGPDGLGVLVPAELMEWLGPDLSPGMEFERFEARWLWFLDSFQFGEETPKKVDPDTVQSDVETKAETQE